MLNCGYCGTKADSWPELREHIKACANRDPWAAYFAAPNAQEARRILVECLGAEPPKPMDEATKARLRAAAADPSRRARRERKRKQRRDLVRAVCKAVTRSRNR
jgi:hypothetical protein